MKLTTILAAVGVAACIAANLPAQLPVCGGVNHVVEDPHDDFVLSGTTRLAAMLTLESSASVERVEWLFSGVTTETVTTNTTNHGAGAGIVEIRTSDPVTGMPSDTILASGSYVDAMIGGGIIVFPIGGWHGATFTSPVILSNGVPYWITFKVGPPVDTIIPNPQSFLAVDVLPTQPTPYTTRASGSAAWQPVLFDKFFKIRVLSTNCTVSGPMASADTIGLGCGGATLTTSGTPAPGSPAFGIQVHSAPGVPAAIFHGAPAPRGGVQLSTTCHLYLDPASIDPTPALAGVTSSAGVLQLSVPVPLDAGLVGASFTLQGAALVPNGPVGIGMSGSGLVLTQAIQVTIGY